MTSLEALMQAALSASADRHQAALRILLGQTEADNQAAGGFTVEPYLTLRALAERLGVSASTLWRWQCPAHNLGNCRRYRLSEVMAHLASDEFQRRAAALRAERRNRFLAKRTDEQSEAKPDAANNGQKTAGPNSLTKFQTTTSE